MQTLLSSRLAMVAVLIVLALIIGAFATSIQQSSVVERGPASRALANDRLFVIDTKQADTHYNATTTISTLSS